MAKIYHPYILQGTEVVSLLLFLPLIVNIYYME